MSNEPEPMLFSMPIVFTDKVPALKMGDIVFGTFEKYLRKMALVETDTNLNPVDGLAAANLIGGYVVPSQFVEPLRTEQARYNALTPEERAKEDEDAAAYEVERHRIEDLYLDTMSGVVATSQASYDAYWWAEGNGSCDCNRNIFPVKEGEPEPEWSGTCAGCHRYLIVKADTKLYTLDELNEDYPEELRRRWLPSSQEQPQ